MPQRFLNLASCKAQIIMWLCPLFGAGWTLKWSLARAKNPMNPSVASHMRQRAHAAKGPSRKNYLQFTPAITAEFKV